MTDTAIETSPLRRALAALPGLLAEWSTQQGAPGVSVGVLQGDTVEVFTHGLANTATGVEVTPGTRFQIGSNTKLWTATVVLQLVDRGQVALDEPVVTYVPEFTLAHTDATTVTIRHLLTHTGGFLGDYFGDSDTHSVADFVAGMATLEQLHPVNALWSYCNSGWVLLGRVIEKVTGLDYSTAVRTLLLDPLEDTTTCMHVEVDPLLTSMGYTPDPADGSLKEAEYGVMPACAPAGSVPTSTPEDILRFVRMHLDGGRALDGTQVLSAESVALMQTHQVDVPGAMAPTDGMGLGWMLKALADGRRAIGHGGGTPSGHVSFLEVVPSERVAVVVLTNGGGGPAVGMKAVEHVLQVLVGADLTPPEVEWGDEPLVLDWSLYEGRYGAGGVTFEVTRGVEHEGLIATATMAPTEQVPEPPSQVVPLMALNASDFAPPVPGVRSTMQFLGFDDAGRPGYFFAGRLYPRIG